MNFNMKNRIWKNLSAMSMAFFMTGMVLGGCGQTTVYAAEVAYESVEFEEHSETEETGIEEAGIEEAGTDESDPDEIQSEENAEETEPEETEDSEEKDQDKANLSDGKSEEEDKENENKKKTPNFTVSVVTDESTVKAGSDLVYTVTLERRPSATIARWPTSISRLPRAAPTSTSATPKTSRWRSSTA